jgi:glycosyltransferase involved in cell wall biosynthesis
LEIISDDNWIPVNYTTGLVSVIIPTYNREVFLQEAIESIITQTYRPIECIVVDDGSTDKSKELVNNFIKRNDENLTVKYIYQQNSGSQAARNIGTAISSGEFIQYLDSDDLLYPDKIKKQVSFLQQNQEYDGVFGDWRMGTAFENKLIQSYAKKDLITQLLSEHFIHTLSFLMRRSLVQKIGEWDSNIRRNQEIDYQLRGLMAAANYQYQEQECGLWRIHSCERIANSTKLKDVLFFFKKWERILESRNQFTSEIKKNISNIYFWFCIQNIDRPDPDRIRMLKETIRLNPSIPFFSSNKIKWLKKIAGINLSIRCWLSWYRFHQKK